jgi:hypothetical protein
MEKYFITKGKEKKGPYSIEELSKMELTDDYLIWKDGFEKWKPITEIIELKSSIIISPPPTPVQLKRANQELALAKSSKISGIWLLILWADIFLVMGGYKSDYELNASYGYGDNAIYGGGSVIRRTLIGTSLLISFVISLFILFFVYRDKAKLKIEPNETKEKTQNDEQITSELK